ncbi:MAG: starch-binding protein [Paludibacteraceae bacterium]|nr:starch-binding protein [Paludibacteraceae bacterium]
MKRLIYTFALLFVTLGAMAYNLSAGKYIYFANTDEWTTSTIQFMIGHSSWSQGYGMTKISNTNLYYWKSSKWDNYTQWAVFGTDAVWGGEGSSISHRKGYAPNSTAVGTKSITASYNLVTTAGAIGSTGASYTFLNKTHTIKSYVDDVESSEGGTINATSYKLNSATTATAISGTTSIEAAYTATIKLTATVNDGYEFIGWYDGSTELSTETTYSYTAPNSAKTISAKFRKLAVAEPQIVSFSASPSEIDLGQSVTFNVEVENAELNDVVFKNGNTVIENPWTPAEGGVYTITANLEGAAPQSVVVTVYAATVFFDNTNSEWAKIYAYCWDEGATIKNADWPGIQLVDPVDNLYAYKTIQPYDSIIFNHGDGDKKTADLLFEDGKTYSMPKPVPVVAGTSNLCGSEWNSSDENNVMEEVDGVFKKTFTDVPAGTHKFKIVYKGSWLGFDKLESNDDCSNVDGGNIQFTLDKSRDVIISFNPTTSKITLKIVYDNFPGGKKFYFSPKSEGARYAAYLFGVSGNIWVDMVEEYNAIYSFIMPEGEWDGLIYCEMKSGTVENKWDNKKVQTANLRYDSVNNWFVESGASWRKFENLIFADQKLYFKPDSNWEADGARFAAYYWDIAGVNSWVDCVYNEESHVYEVVAPTKNDPNCAWTNVKFVRMKSTPTSNDWANKLHETGDLTYDGENDLFVIKLADKKDLNSADKTNWISFANPFKDVIYLHPNTTLAQAEKKRFSVYFWNGFGQHCWVKFTELTTHSGYYCAVVPEGYWTGANICSMNPDTENDSWDKVDDVYVDLLLQTDNVTYHKDKLLYQLPESWKNNVPANECWVVLNLPKADDVDCSSEVRPGVYYTYFKRTLSISTPADIAKWHWISLPYNVKISEIEGGVFGSDFIIQEYDTEARAKWENNIAAENESAWRMMEAGETLLAGKGYILAVNNEKSSYTLTFVSETDLNVVADIFNGNNIDYPNANVPESANWHLIGTGLYGAANSFGGVDYVAVPQDDDYLYYNLSNDGLANINAYGAFFVQHSGDYSFSKVQPAQNAAPRRARAEEMVEQYYVNIVGMADTSHTAILLAEDGSDDYVVGKDFLHLGASGASLQLYTLQGESTLSFNYLKREDRTVLVGGYVAQSGKYTISLDGNGDASSVTLYDATTGLVADLLNENYEFEAEKGILDGRFSVIISYAAGDGPTTMIGDNENVSVVVSNYDGIAHFEELLVGESVVVYDVMGRCVTQFVAESDEADVMLTSGVYMLYHNGETVKFVVNR